ncbi:MAG TPA: hypothetical protein VLA91_06260 [Acidimicrobiia bacterium]|nr:hypothetical protein [Acidimicrobiia bacterium]
MLIARDLRIDAGIRTLIRDVSFSVQAGDRPACLALTGLDVDACRVFIGMEFVFGEVGDESRADGWKRGRCRVGD